MMRGWKIFLLLGAFLSCVYNTMGQNYMNNRPPLVPKKYIELPLGSIKARGWLEKMLIRQKNGATGKLDELYPSVMGPRNGWLGGDGDQWERGPYWIDGLLPLAYILDSKELIAKTQPWIEWAIKSQQPNGYFGPLTDYGPEPGLQRDRAQDWWPKMVMLKVLQQYYSATNDKRIIDLLLKYFRYQLNTLPQKPLGHWSFWAEYRAADNLNVVYWLYNITGEKFLLELGDLIHKQTFDFKTYLTTEAIISRFNNMHGVNLAQGLKSPIIYYQKSGDISDVQSVKTGLQLLKHYHGFPTGMYGADEMMHGANPTQGSELCSAVELMYSLENMLAITGDVDFADHLERIAFNVLPSQIDEHFINRQYFQQINQVKISRDIRNFDINHAETDVLYGFLTGFPCCTSNMHQGWPKFTQHLWFATSDNGVAALVYAPSVVNLKVGPGIPVTIREETFYPFDETIQFTIQFEKHAAVRFPFHFRIPKWCSSPKISINGHSQAVDVKDGIIILDKEWRNGDVVELQLSMEVTLSRWYEQSVAVERGPLVYALKVDGKKEEHRFSDKDSKFGTTYVTYEPTTPWNFGFTENAVRNVKEHFKVVKQHISKDAYPWRAQNAPIHIETVGRQLPFWTMYNNMAGPQPNGNTVSGSSLLRELPEHKIVLIPFGCTILRVAEFPVIRN